MPLSIEWRNPIAVEGQLRRTWLFVYRTPVAAARAWLPAGLEPVAWGEFAFWNVVVCRVGRIRPVGLPAWLGVSYWHVGYRLYARLRRPDGVWLEGLYFARSDADQPLIATAGDWLTDYHFHSARVETTVSPSATTIAIQSTSAPAQLRLNRSAPVQLGAGSPFSSVDVAATALKYGPFGLSVDASRQLANVVAIERDESAWRARPIAVEAAEWGFFADQPVAFEMAFEAAPIHYRWRRGTLLNLTAASTPSPSGAP